MRTENPLSGWPTTKPLRKKPGYRVTAKYLTPERAKITDLAAKAIVAGGVVMLGWSYINKQFASSDEFFVVAGVIGAICAWVWFRRYKFGRSYFGKVSTVQFRPETIRIKGGMGFKNYDRGLPHEFDYSIHDKAEWEEEKEIEARQNAAREGKKEPPKKGKYYRRSFHVVLRYAGQRVDVAAVFGKKDAEALLMRLQLLDQMMDAAKGDIGEPAFAEPATQYGERPEAG